MTEDKELEMIMENKKWRRNAFLTVGGVVIAIVAIIGLLFGKVVEATLLGEIAKWAVMSVVIAVIVCVICWVPITMLSDARGKLYPEYGKDWFKHLFKKK